MIAYSRQKVKEGKIVKVEAQFDNVITKLKISGDFFLHPEEVDVYEALVNAFIEGKEYDFGALSKQEYKRSSELAREKYRSDEWMYLR